MTIREFYKAVAVSNVSDEIKTFATEALAKMDEKNEKRRNTPSKAQIANEPIKQAILEALATAPCGIRTRNRSGSDHAEGFRTLPCSRSRRQNHRNRNQG